MAESQGIQPNANVGNNFQLKSSLNSGLKKIGKAFNRIISPHPKQKNRIPKQSSGCPQNEILLRSAKPAAPKNYINPSHLPAKTGKTQPNQKPQSHQQLRPSQQPQLHQKPQSHQKPKPNQQPQLHQKLQSQQQLQSHQQPQPQPRTSGEGAGIYDNTMFRTFVARERVTEKFANTMHTSKSLLDAAWSMHQEGKNSPGGYNLPLLTKAGQLGLLSSNMSEHSRALGQPLSPAPGGIERQGRQVIDNLQKGINQLDQLLLQQGYKMLPNERQYLLVIKQTLHNEQKLMLQVMDDPGAVPVAGKVNLLLALELKRLGYDLNPTLIKHFSPFNDNHLIPGSEQKFGSGMLHSVTKLNFQSTAGVVEKIFKAEDTADASAFDIITGPENYLDKNKPRFAARNLASAKFDKLLGTGLMPTMELTVHNGQMGLLMDVAKGVKPFDQSINGYNRIPVEDDRKPAKAANIQKQLNSAEWLDGICAQQDRHAGNLFIEPNTGKVTLIDNDVAFSPGLHEVRTPAKPNQFRQFSGSGAGLPAVIDFDVFQKLMAISPQQVYQQMDGLITDREIEATVSRVKQLQKHAGQLARNGQVIKNWKKWKDPATGLNAAQFQRKYAPHCYMLSVQGQSKGL